MPVSSCSRFTPAVNSFTMVELTMRVQPKTAVFEGTPKVLLGPVEARQRAADAESLKVHAAEVERVLFGGTVVDPEQVLAPRIGCRTQELVVVRAQR